MLICYPPHSTHILQGLDVRVFGQLKVVFGEVCLKWEDNRGTVDKDSMTFLIGMAYNKVFTPVIIKSAFKAVGLWPFSCTAVGTAAIIPAESTSMAADGRAPLPTAVK